MILFSTPHHTNFEVNKAYLNFNVSESDTSTYVFIPFSLFRNHPIWKFSSENSSNDECILSHLNWLKQRISLLEKITIPSLKLQVYKNFKIVLMIDSYLNHKEIQYWLSRRLKQLFQSNSLSVDLLEINMCGEGDIGRSYFAYVAPKIKEYLLKDCTTKHLICYRLDSDDGLLPMGLYMSQLVSRLYRQSSVTDDPILFDFPFGCQYTSKDKKLYSSFWPEGTFASLFFNRICLADKNFQGLFGYSHDKIPDNICRIPISSHIPHWIMGIHESNVMNSLFPWSYYIATQDNTISLFDLISDLFPHSYSK